MPRYNRAMNAMIHRLEWLSAWLEMRNFNIRNERMDFLCFVYSSAKICFLDEDAKEKTREINSKLTLPFSEEKLQKHIFGKKVLKIKNANCKFKLDTQR